MRPRRVGLGRPEIVRKPVRKSISAFTGRPIFSDIRHIAPSQRTLASAAASITWHTIERFVSRLSPLGDHSPCFAIAWHSAASLSARSVSHNVRLRPPMFSRIVRRKWPLIARPPHFDCAPLHLTAPFGFSSRRLPPLPSFLSPALCSTRRRRVEPARRAGVGTPFVPTASEHRHAQRPSRGSWNKWRGPAPGADAAFVGMTDAFPPGVGRQPFMPRKPLDGREHGGRLELVGRNFMQREKARL